MPENAYSKLMARLDDVEARLRAIEDNQRISRANFWLLLAFVVEHAIQSFL